MVQAGLKRHARIGHRSLHGLLVTSSRRRALICNEAWEEHEGRDLMTDGSLFLYRSTARDWQHGFRRDERDAGCSFSTWTTSPSVHSDLSVVLLGERIAVGGRPPV